jgi:hypothetical protein
LYVCAGAAAAKASAAAAAASLRKERTFMTTVSLVV